MKKLFYIIIIFIINLIICQDDKMNYIIDNIYLGNVHAADDEDYLKSYNITTVINCAVELYSSYKDLKFLELRMYDYNDEPLFPKFEIAYEFIKLNNKGNILIHCFEGKSRSASLVVFYLMKEKGWDYDKCFKYMKEKRPIVYPTSGFEQQLRQYYDKYIKKK